MLEELKTFIAVIDHQNFTKAAEAINLSQPSVSIHIKHLESELGVSLINRSSKKKKIIVTKAGELLYKRAKKIIDIIEQTKNDLHELQYGHTGTLRIGASFTIGEYILPNLLSTYAKRFPKVTIEVTIGNTSSISQKVSELKLDVGLVEGMNTHEGLFREDFYQDSLVVTVPNGHPATQLPFSLDSLQNQTWISREEGSGTAEYLKWFLMTNNIQPKNIVIFGSNYAVKEAVKHQLGVTYISSLVAEKSIINEDISIVKAIPPKKRPFSYILPLDSTPIHTVTSFIDFLKEAHQNAEG
ncbi:MAG: LysR family transcriptional regulator [Bacillaceae bacterium]